MLEHELNLNKSFELKSHEALLNIYFTTLCIKKRGSQFLKPHGLTDVQLNLMLLLEHQTKENGGLSQARISEMMLVNRANITSLVDRMEKADLVQRTAEESDRRYNIIKLTKKGKKLLDKVEPAYRNEVERIMSCLSPAEQNKLMKMLEKIRTGI